MGFVRLLFSFNGRIGRAEYLLGLAIALVGLCLGLVAIGAALRSTGLEALGMIIVGVLFFWAKFALAAKRLHDLGRSGFWCLALFVPVVGFVLVLMFLFVSGEEYDNQYGPGPKVALPEPEATFPAVKGPTS
jgi:uncharacterized membrane protein YhaH (DUF805 family)